MLYGSLSVSQFCSCFDKQPHQKYRGKIYCGSWFQFPIPWMYCLQACGRAEHHSGGLREGKTQQEMESTTVRDEGHSDIVTSLQGMPSVTYCRQLGLIC